MEAFLLLSATLCTHLAVYEALVAPLVPPIVLLYSIYVV
jgi:hypothetical protein